MLRIEIIAAVFSCHVGRGDAGGVRMMVAMLRVVAMTCL